MAGIEGVAETVSYEVEGDDDEEYGAGGGEQYPRKVSDFGYAAGLIEHDSPTDLRFLYADAEEAEGDFAEDEPGNGDAGADDDVTEGVWQDMEGENP